MSEDSRPHLVAVNRFYWPDHSATSQLLTDLCEHAAARGFRVSVVTSRLRYDNPRARLAPRENRNGVAIHRVASTMLGQGGLGGRTLDYVSFYPAAFGMLLRLAGRGDVVLAKTDPPLVSVPAALAARLTGARLVNWLQDVFPEVAGALGIGWAGGAAGAVLRRLRNRSLRAAAGNVAISGAMAERIAAEGIDPRRLRVIPNWCDRAIRPVPRAENSLRAAWGLSGRFVIGYSGNLGRAHAAGAVAELVRRTADLAHVSWLFVGGGSGQAQVKAAAAEAGVDVRFRPYQDVARLSESLSAADLHLVSLDPCCEGLIVPSKLAAVMAAGRGVLALGDPDGAVARAVRAAEIGAVLDPATPGRWRDQVAGLASFAAADAAGARSRDRHVRSRATTRALDAWLDMLRASLGECRAAPEASEASPRLGAAETPALQKAP